MSIGGRLVTLTNSNNYAVEIPLYKSYSKVVIPGNGSINVQVDDVIVASEASQYQYLTNYVANCTGVSISSEDLPDNSTTAINLTVNYDNAGTITALSGVSAVLTQTGDDITKLTNESGKASFTSEVNDEGYSIALTKEGYTNLTITVPATTSNFIEIVATMTASAPADNG